jgi:hypothetical protein
MGNNNTFNDRKSQSTAIDIASALALNCVAKCFDMRLKPFYKTLPNICRS